MGVINGWRLIDRNLKRLNSSIFELFVPISRSMLIDYNSAMALSCNLSIPSIPISQIVNLGIISLLQLAYWYHKCSATSTFNLKEDELREKLTGFVKAFNESSNDVTNKLKKIINDMDDCVSELNVCRSCYEF